MGLVVPDLQMPCNCLECMFKVPVEELRVKGGLYKKISHCMFAPKHIDDPWRDLDWMLKHKEDYCPLKSYKEHSTTGIEPSDIEDGIVIPQGEFYVEGIPCVVASYSDSQFILKVLDTIPYGLSPRVLNIFIRKYGCETRLCYNADIGHENECIVVIPTKYIIERGGLL